MKKHKKASSKSSASEKLDALMRDLHTEIDTGASPPGSCRRIYCTP